MRTIDTIIIHCLATRPSGWFADLSQRERFTEVKLWHTLPKPKGNGWSDIGYNALIWREGDLVAGRDLDHDGDYFDEIGAHTFGHNARSLGLALEGGHGANADDPFEKNFTVEQRDTLIFTLRSWVSEFPSIKRIAGHNEFAKKACPGFSVPEFLRGVSGLDEFAA